MEVLKNRLEKIMELYTPSWKYLKKAEVNYPKATGEFKLGDTAYTIIPFEHMTVIEAQICLNQLSYAAFAEWILEGRFKALEMSFVKYLKLMLENQLIIDSHIRFRKPIRKDRQISGEIKLVRVKRLRDLGLALLDYNIEEGKSNGQLELILKL